MQTLSLLLLLPASALASFNLLSLPEAGGLPELPNGTTTNPACLAAYNATIDCDPSVITSSFGSDGSTLPTAEELDGICTPQCLTSLRKWVRGGDGCAGEEYLNYFGLNREGFFDNGTNATIADIYQYYITASYHAKCLKQLNKTPSKYCILTDQSSFAQPALLNTSNPDTLCKYNTCGTQAAYLWEPVKTIYKYDPANQTESSGNGESDLPMLSLEEACPGIDTSKYPAREADVTAEMLGGSSSGNGGTNGGNPTGGGDKPNAAPGKAVEKMTVMFGVVLGMVGYYVL
ncbi:hypothetical protein ABW20_dc0110057 [Dactylellina cionopaga]|nr:hypothetical protein ABW20_dc0110057 [Dactylellina cionopaga]